MITRSVLVAGASLLAAALHAQASGGPVTSAVVFLGSEAEDRLRMDQLRGTAALAGWLIRSPTTLAARDSGGLRRSTPLCRAALSAVPPAADLTWNSKLPFARNDGAQWAGRGLTLSVTGGAQLHCGRLRARLAPTAWYAQNRAFPVIGAGAPGFSGFASPFHSDGESFADVPLRFGTQPLLVIEPGESMLEVDAGIITLGVASESQWWGPGIRTGLVMSNHAAGIPRFHARTTAPVRSPLGLAEARWMVGGLTESIYFDADSRNDLRSLSGLVIVLHPAFDTTLAIGISRVVYASVPGVGALPARFLDAVARWGEGADVRAATWGRAAEQMTNLFARWVVPGAGIEAYADWARVILPNSLRALLVAPQVSQGYTVGAQWLSPGDSTNSFWRAQAEFSMLEQPLVSRAQPAPSFYASPVVRQGYTHRGQVIGSSLGPGSSAQWLGLDHYRGRHHAGLLLGRLRRENDEYFRQRSGFDKYAHDVSFVAGLRAGRMLTRSHLALEALSERRLNYLFQNRFTGYGEDAGFDVSNLSLRLSVTPR